MFNQSSRIKYFWSFFSYQINLKLCFKYFRSSYIINSHTLNSVVYNTETFHSDERCESTTLLIPIHFVAHFPIKRIEPPRLKLYVVFPYRQKYGLTFGTGHNCIKYFVLHCYNTFSVFLNCSGERFHTV